MNPFRRTRSPWRGDDRLFRNGVRTAFGGALLFAVLGGLYAVWNLADGSAPGLLHDGARHAYTVGFVTILIVSFAGRVLPVFTGAGLKRPGLLAWGLGLIAAGVALREAQVLAALLASAAPLAVSGASGVVVVAGLVLSAVSLLGTLRAAGRAERAVVAPVRAPVSADVKVGELVDDHPELLPVLIEAGFTPLANPVMRRLMGRTVTLRTACALKGVEPEPLLERLEQACTHRAVSAACRDAGVLPS